MFNIRYINDCEFIKSDNEYKSCWYRRYDKDISKFYEGHKGCSCSKPLPADHVHGINIGIRFTCSAPDHNHEEFIQEFNRKKEEIKTLGQTQGIEQIPEEELKQMREAIEKGKQEDAKNGVTQEYLKERFGNKTRQEQDKHWEEYKIEREIERIKKQWEEEDQKRKNLQYLVSGVLILGISGLALLLGFKTT
jgi:hypothetical protein